MGLTSMQSMYQTLPIPYNVFHLSISVDAALAELDSIPDEVCEAGDVEEEDEEEEEWSYYRMDLQTQPQVRQDQFYFFWAFHEVVSVLGDRGGVH